VETCGWAKSKENWAYENLIERVTVGKREEEEEEEKIMTKERLYPNHLVVSAHDSRGIHACIAQG